MFPSKPNIQNSLRMGLLPATSSKLEALMIKNTSLRKWIVKSYIRRKYLQLMCLIKGLYPEYTHIYKFAKLNKQLMFLNEYRPNMKKTSRFQYTQKTVKIGKCSKAGYKINTQKLIVFLY